MDCPMLSRKRPPSDGWDEPTSLYTKTCLTGLEVWWDRYQTGIPERTTRQGFHPSSLSHFCVPEASQNRKSPPETTRLSEQTSSWSDAQTCVKKVVERLNSKRGFDDFALSDSVNKKFLEFHHDITGEFGAEDKQHSWAVLEKKEEVIMYGPYYPNYNKEEHSEDFIIKQTQELLESEGFPESWKVYIFTMNSPCLARNINSCMLNLVNKAQEWWRLYGVKTHIGFMRCWGFKGSKESTFKDVTYRQVECMSQSVSYEDYVETAKNTSTDLQLLCGPLFCVARNLLESGQVDKFPLITTMQKQDRKSYYKSMHETIESKPEDERKMLTQEVKAVTEAADVLLAHQPGSVEEYLESGRAFILDYAFASQVSNALQEEMKLRFQRCWTEMVHDMYAEFIRQKLTEDFNHCAVQLFINDVLRFTKEYLQIGKVEFPKEDSNMANKNTLKTDAGINTGQTAE